MIRTRPPSKEYDAGWDAIFGTKRSESDLSGLKELTGLTEEFGGYDAELAASSTPTESDTRTESTDIDEERQVDDSVRGVTRPRGWTQKHGDPRAVLKHPRGNHS